jgi:hypothetical protein
VNIVNVTLCYVSILSGKYNLKRDNRVYLQAMHFTILLFRNGTKSKLQYGQACIGVCCDDRVSSLGVSECDVTSVFLLCTVGQ